MAKIQLGTPQEKELAVQVLEKLNDFGWADNDVLANFIVVMVANEKSKDDIVAELNDTMEFADWLFQEIDIRYGDGMAQEHVAQPVEIAVQEQSAEFMDTASTRSRPLEPRSAGRLLQTAISSATRAEPAATHRQAPSRVYGGERRERREPRERSTSPVRSREGLTTKSKEERVRFRRTDDEISRNEARIASRLGTRGGCDGLANGRADPLRGRLGPIEDRLGKREYTNLREQRDRSWDNGNEYHDRRGDRTGRSNNREAALRDINRRLGTHPVTESSVSDNEDTPRQPASWTRDPERMFRVEAERTRKAIELESAGITRCKFWPNCTQGENCQFWHPKTLCADYPNCSKTADTCLYVHPLAEPTAEQVAAAARQALMQSMRNNPNNSGAPALNALQSHLNCPFYHPSPSDATAQSSSMEIAGAVEGQEVFNRLPMPCRFGDQCTRPGCHFTHPRDGAASNVPLCKFNPCTRPGCPFRHAPGAATIYSAGNGQNRSLVLNGGSGGFKLKMSERFSGGVVTEGEVEKLHVPASVYWSGAAPNRVTNTSATEAVTLNQAEMEAAELAAAAEMDMDMDGDL
ncbi:hypothetical protein BGZ95_001851 [Linnemannia exigua]|uniref:C3H1-type domain-containing protein n=1 Tax=Linnemannia exigua TaxID=604196 RepID=A0AAD4H3G1_9FUNG|nr:hypothetical protein BGZ95_001851 [Linnemannia exigua]